jgi:hypothetical protein
MGRYFELLDGKNLVDGPVTIGDYTFYGYQDREGGYVILREKNDLTETRYMIGANGKLAYSTAWSGKATTYTGSFLTPIQLGV